MVIYTTSSNSRRALVGEGFDGVVRVSSGGYYATGFLLLGGRAVLTAAHLVETNSATASVEFETAQGFQTVGVSQILMHEQYSVDGNNDMALLWLDASAPVAAQRYELYRQANEVNQVFTMVGYGVSGTGTSGYVSSDSGSYLRLKASNRFDALADELKYFMGSNMAWTPADGTQLVADFDNGTRGNDALGLLMGIHDTGQGILEGVIAPGDSGGPAFINGQVAGLASYVASLSKLGAHPDVDSVTNSSFGEVAAWQRMSVYQQWIDQAIRARMMNAPSKPEQVQKTVVEGHSGTVLVYFLLTLNGLRTDPNLWLSVDFATRDGTALAGQDYLSVSGTATLYPDEDHAVIPVEVMGDGVPEPSEYFYLDVFNPVGANFEAGAVKLTAVRFISDDDGWWS